MTKLNIFVLGLDEQNLEPLHDLPRADRYRFHQLLPAERLLPGDEEVDIRALLEEARQVLEDFDGSVDAIVGYWDFPVSSMVPILCRSFGLPSASLEAVVKCEHKYWSRVEQAKVIDEHPRFAIIDLDDPGELPSGLSFPLWLKPVKSASSELAFRVENQAEYDEALDELRDGVDRLGRPFEAIMDRIDLPDEIEQIGGAACLAEEAVTGRQVTVEGYSTADRVEVYGIIDSITYPDSSSFLRYEYPTQLPEAVSRRLVDASAKVIRQLGLTDSTFNIEYFWDPDTDAVNLLEVNPRHSQSHARMFELVDGVPNHQAMVRLGLGHDPDLPHRKGEYAMAAKWFVRRFSDGVVRRTPTPDEVQQVEREIPGVAVNLTVEEGDRMSELTAQDSYSFELADIFVGADDPDELVEKYERCMSMLPLEVDDLEES